MIKEFYRKFLVRPLFLLLVHLVPGFIDVAYDHIQEIQHAVLGKLMLPDYIDQVRKALGK